MAWKRADHRNTFAKRKDKQLAMLIVRISFPTSPQAQPGIYGNLPSCLIFMVTIQGERPWTSDRRRALARGAATRSYRVTLTCSDRVQM